MISMTSIIIITKIIVIIVSSISYIMSITIVIVFISMIDIMIIISRGPRSLTCALPSVIHVLSVCFGSARTAAISARWAFASVTAVWLLI